MKNPTRRILGLAAASLVLAATAQAQGKSHEKGDKGDKGKAKGMQVDERRDNDRDDRMRDRERDERNRERDRYEDRNRNVIVHNGDVNVRRVPPGLAKKPGQMPPGQYKKRYGVPQGVTVLQDIFGRRGYTVVRTEPFGESQYVYYRLRDGSVQRAIVSPGTDRLGFTNVPASLLREVLARLY